MSGTISQDTVKQINMLITDFPEVTTIVMDDVAGSLDDDSNIEASKMVREAGLNILVPKDGMIASGGTDFLCAGIIRTVEEGAQIGVHSWFNDTVDKAAILPKDDPSHSLYIDYYEEMGMPDPSGFYFFTLEMADADDIHWMSM